jgi:hypothetical protein
MVQIQLEFFDKVDEITLMQKQIDKIDEVTSNVRRGLFSRLDGMFKMIQDQQKEIDSLRKCIIGEKNA